MVVSLPDLMLLGAEKKLTACLLLLLLELFLEGAESVPNAADIEKHLELGKQFLANNDLSSALTHFHAAVEGEPNNYLTFFKRGTVYLGIGKARFAINDFTRVLELKPDFTAARLQRATVYMKSGQYEQAKEDFSIVLDEEPYNDIANQKYSLIKAAEQQWEEVQKLMNRGDYDNSIKLLTQLLEVSPWSKTFRQTRANAYIAKNDKLAAIPDLTSVNKLSQDNPDGYYKLALHLYNVGHVIKALNETRECLKLDPDHKDCFTFYKKVKLVEKGLTNAEKAREDNKFTECIKYAEMALKHEKTEEMVIFEAKRLLCACYVHDEQYENSLEYCKDALEIRRDAEIYCDRADAYLGIELYDEAIHDFQQALRIDENLKRAKEGLEKAKNRQKQAERRDYYKILGVSRHASKQEIIKAYRRAAQKWHPDNFHGDKKKIAENKFIDIAAAKEVLTDPEKRKQFDNGQDPLDPESQQGGHGFHGGNPFQHFHHGSPFQFKFHFN